MDSQDGRIFLAMVPNGWAVDKDPNIALTQARRYVGMYARELRKATHFVLAFPATAQIQVTELGSWIASEKPLEVVLAKNLPNGLTEADLIAT